MAFYTKAYLLAETRAILNEPTALFWTDTELNDFIDWGARTISGITLCNPVTEILSTGAGVFVANGLWANSTTDFIKIEDVSITSSTPTTKHLQRADIRAFGHGAGTWGAASGDVQPLYYSIHGMDSTATSTTAQPITTIFLWPTPYGIWSVGATLNVYGYRVAEQYVAAADGGATHYEIPDRLQGKLIDFVLACAYAKAGKYSLTRHHMATFMQNAAFDRKNVYEAKLMVDSKDRFDIPDRTQQGGQ